MFLFLSQVLQHPLQPHVLTSRNVWSVMSERRWGTTSLCSWLILSTARAWAPDSASVLSPGEKSVWWIRAVILGLDVQSQLSSISNRFNPVTEWGGEKSRLYSWAVQPVQGGWESPFLFWVTVGLCESVFWSPHTGWFLLCILGLGRAKPISSTLLPGEHMLLRIELYENCPGRVFVGVQNLLEPDKPHLASSSQESFTGSL